MGTYKTGMVGIDYCNINSYTMYTIKPGDTLSEIAVRNNVSLQGLLNDNPQFTQKFERKTDLVHPGEKVLIHSETGILINSRGKKYIYTCNCGWIDLSHLRDPLRDPKDPSADKYVGARTLWEQVKNEEIHESHFNKITYVQEMGPKMGPKTPFHDVGIMTPNYRVGVTKRYCFPFNLSLDKKKSIALAIFQEVSLEFEALQGKIPLPQTIESSFSSEDLVSNLLGFYMAVNGYTEEFIMTLCKPVSEETANKIPDPHKSKNHTFTPTLYENEECGKEAKFPSEFQSIKPASKGKDFFECDDLGGNSKKGNLILA